jgi:DNA helicase-2/ATP-dependent DNA helicase PcrA
MIELTPEQLEAAEHRDGNLLIVAGAGTGKTTTLAARLASLMSSGVAPERILLITFTRRAATELLHRAEQLAGTSAARAWGGTFHSVANRLLRRHGRALGLEPCFSVLDQSDTADLLDLVRNEIAPGPTRRRARKHTLAEIASRCVNARSPLSETLRDHFPWCSEERAEIKAVFHAYSARKRSSGLLDFDDLLLGWGALLELDDVATVLRAQFDHILVDEYQDTNPLQADLLDQMRATGATVTAVGDDAQAIYSFRGASHRNIMEFPTRFGARVVTLERNHRSTPSLLAATNALISEARNRHKKQLWSMRSDGPVPTLERCQEERDQSRRVADRIVEHLEAGTSLKQQAVLIRSTHHSDLLELELTARKIPFVKYGGLRFLEAAHVKDLVCLLRLTANPHDELAWFRVLQLVDGVGPARARRVTEELVPAPQPVAALSEAVGGFPEGARDKVTELAVCLAEAGGLGSAAAGAAVERVRAWLDPLLEKRYPNVNARKADLDQLERMASSAPTLTHFLADLTLDPPASTSDLAGPPSLEEDYITIGTIHSAKGCEWDVVHIIHVTDGHIPSDLATGDAEAIEEERRLLYVAMTRARRHLYLYAPLRYHFMRGGLNDPHGYGQLTRFLTPAVLESFRQNTYRPGFEEGFESEDAPSAAAVAGPPLQAVDRLVASLWD